MLDLPATPRPRRVAAAGHTVHVVEWGTSGSPPVLLLHGGMSHARWWDPVAARLAARLHVFAVDMPGHGDSPWLEPPRYAIDRETAIAADLLSTLAPGPWTLAGHSHGALLTAVVTGSALAAPARAVLVDMPPDPMAPHLVRAGLLFRRFPQPRFASLDEAVAAFRFFPGDGEAAPDMLRHVAEHSFRPDGDGGWTTKFDWRYFRDRSPDEPSPLRAFADLLARMPCPTLVVRGERSTILDASGFAELVARLPHATGATIPGAGHNPHVEQPEATAAAVAGFAAPSPPAG